MGKLYLYLLYPQNGDRIVTTDYVTSLRPIYASSFIVLVEENMQANKQREKLKKKINTEKILI